MHPSVHRLWRAYLRSVGETPASTDKTFAAWSFGDTPALADALAALVLRGAKRATSPSAWELEAHGEPRPQRGDLNIVTDAAGVAQCIIRTTHVEVVPFNRVGADYARLEGEGDSSLADWRRTHWAYYERVLDGAEHRPEPRMPIVCEQFEVVFTREDAAMIEAENDIH